MKGAESIRRLVVVADAEVDERDCLAEILNHFMSFHFASDSSPHTRGRLADIETKRFDTAIHPRVCGVDPNILWSRHQSRLYVVVVSLFIRGCYGFTFLNSSANPAEHMLLKSISDEILPTAQAISGILTASDL